MKISLILFGVLLFKNFQTSLNKPFLYTEVTDCSDGKYSSFVASITPNPFVWVYSSASSFWVGVKASFTEEAKNFASNISLNNFDRDLQYYTVFDESTWAWIPDPLKKYSVEKNYTHACGKVLGAEFCPTILQAMSLPLTNATAFSSFQWDSNNRNVMLDYINLILEITQIDIKFQIGISLYGQTLFCMQIVIKDVHYDNINGSASAYRSSNIQLAFDTAKIINVHDQNKVSCPENSTEVNTSSCECNHPFSGPLCSFHCWYDEIIEAICPIGTNFDCTYNDGDYITHCIKEKHVQYLDGKVTVDHVSLNYINIKWKLAHFIASYKYELSLLDNTGSVVGSIVWDAFFLKGLEVDLSIVSLCLNDVAYGMFDCRNATYDTAYCYDCPDLSLIPFHNYTIVLKLGIGPTRILLTHYVTTTATFTTPEVDVMAPKITGAVLDDDQNFASVGWMLTDKWCPGYIRRYELIVSCNSDLTISSGNLYFDCRNGFQGPKLNGAVPGKCKSEDIYLKLRIATTNSTSDESEQFLLKNAALSTLAIVAYILGALFIAAAIATVIFYYYYKRHIKSFQNAHQTVRKLLHIQRRRHSFRDRIAPNLPIPGVPESCNSPGETAYQTIAATSEVGTPRSLQAPVIQHVTVSTNPPVYDGYTTGDFSEDMPF